MNRKGINIIGNLFEIAELLYNGSCYGNNEVHNQNKNIDFSDINSTVSFKTYSYCDLMYLVPYINAYKRASNRLNDIFLSDFGQEFKNTRMYKENIDAYNKINTKIEFIIEKYDYFSHTYGSFIHRVNRFFGEELDDLELDSLLSLLCGTSVVLDNFNQIYRQVNLNHFNTNKKYSTFKDLTKNIKDNVYIPVKEYEEVIKNETEKIFSKFIYSSLLNGYEGDEETRKEILFLKNAFYKFYFKIEELCDIGLELLLALSEYLNSQELKIFTKYLFKEYIIEGPDGTGKSSLIKYLIKTETDRLRFIENIFMNDETKGKYRLKIFEENKDSVHEKLRIGYNKYCNFNSVFNMVGDNNQSYNLTNLLPVHVSATLVNNPSKELKNKLIDDELIDRRRNPLLDAYHLLTKQMAMYSDVEKQDDDLISDLDIKSFITVKDRHFISNLIYTMGGIRLESDAVMSYKNFIDHKIKNNNYNDNKFFKISTKMERFKVFYKNYVEIILIVLNSENNFRNTQDNIEKAVDREYLYKSYKLFESSETFKLNAYAYNGYLNGEVNNVETRDIEKIDINDLKDFILHKYVTDGEMIGNSLICDTYYGKSKIHAFDKVFYYESDKLETVSDKCVKIMESIRNIDDNSSIHNRHLWTNTDTLFININTNEVESIDNLSASQDMIQKQKKSLELNDILEDNTLY